MEIEIKVKVENVKPLVALLEQEGKKKLEDHQVDKYYNSPYRDFLAIAPYAEWFRLRDSNGKFSINYKKWHYDEDGKSHHCDEEESLIENLEALQNILDALNFKPLITVNKQRISWDYKNYEISLDTVEGLGDFVEIEFIGQDNSDPKAVAAEMMNFLEKLDCGELSRDFKGYPYLLLEKEGLI
jgi:adenylate cyclase class 2